MKKSKILSGVIAIAGWMFFVVGLVSYNLKGFLFDYDTEYAKGFEPSKLELVECRMSAEQVLGLLGQPMIVVETKQDGSIARSLKVDTSGMQNILPFDGSAESIQWVYSKQGKENWNWFQVFIEFYTDGSLKRAIVKEQAD